MTVAHVYTVAFQGIEAREVDVQVHIGEGSGGVFNIVGLADKAVGESKERVRAALAAIGLALPYKRLTVNLAPADLPKEGSHYDLPIALGLLAAMGVLPASEIANYVAMGELSLDAQITAVAGVLPAAIAASAQQRGLICPAACGPEAAWAGGLEIIAAPSLIALVNHMKGVQVLNPPVAKLAQESRSAPDLKDVKGQETAKRALEIAAAGGHNLLMIGPPGAGKSMLAQRLPGLLPPLDAREALEISMVQSLAGELPGGAISRRRPVPQSASFRIDGPLLIGGGLKVKPGEVSLAHLGVLFLDELLSFSGQFWTHFGNRLKPARRWWCAGAHALSGPVPARRRDESVPLRVFERTGAGLRSRTQMRDGLSELLVGTAARSHRSACRGRGRLGCRPDLAAAGRGGSDEVAARGRKRAGHPAPPL